ncbi:Ig-like domain-containing protein [Pleionea sp. CnH1-48]|uniref:Ig-like domain-containing protein n=1 Tax=Pleionea sp. CnH1-48 TaxID=2954494 RepID=UPI002097B7C4|nr:Ig-like domain-containing protein [Pleionea sp. CnH1-48]MCO7223666.1 Ig-like domain-containing protein [Pleionea sp. CnH1-48]
MHSITKSALICVLLFCNLALAKQAAQQPDTLFQRILKVADHAWSNMFRETFFFLTNSPLEGCIDKSYTLQGSKRFPVGKAYYLPTITDSDDCESAFWYLKYSPSTNSSLPIKNGAATTFTPPITGTYVFKLWGTRESIAVTVKANDIAYEHYNYYPSRSLAKVNDEIWVANNYRSSLSRIDPVTMEKLGEIETGQWPVAVASNNNTPFPIVVQQAEDTIGFINPITQRIEESLWVGDEPSNIVVSNNGQLAYVTLSTSGKVAVVDLNSRQVIKKITVGAFPKAMAISPDNTKLYVGSYRSGTPNRVEYDNDPIEAEKDITVIDLNSLTVEHTFIDYGNVIRSMVVSDDNQYLFVSITQGFNDTGIFNPAEVSFADEVVKIDLQSKTIVDRIDLYRQTGMGLEENAAFNLFGLIYKNNRVYVVSEAYETIIEIDADSMTEIKRVVSGEGRPRGLLIDSENNFYVHNSQGFNLTKVDLDSEAIIASVQTAEDPRTPGMAHGQRYFTNTGIGVGIDRGCNTCHVDGEIDTLVWLNGAAGEPVLAKPLIWMEGTAPMTWNGNVTSIEGYSLAGNASVGRKPTKEEFTGLYEYMSGVMAPPPANDWTERDGSLSAEGELGREVFDNAGCRDCHSGKIYTDNQRYMDPEGATLSDTTTLISTYRRGTWGKRGDDMTLAQSVERMAEEWSHVNLSADELESLTRYVAEITGRNFFLLLSYPQANEVAAAVDQPVRLEFSHSIWNNPHNIEKVSLRDANGNPVDASITLLRNEIVITPSSLLDYDSHYVVNIDESFEAHNEMAINEPLSVSFKTAKKPTVTLDPNESYEWFVDFPHIDLSLPSGISPTHTAVVVEPFSIEITPSGIALDVKYFDNDTGSNIERVIGVIDGDKLSTGRMGIPAGPLALADTPGMMATLVDHNGDGIADLYPTEVVNEDPPPPFPSDDGTHIEAVLANGNSKVLSTWFEEDVTWRVRAKEVIDVPPGCQSEPNDNGLVETQDNGSFGVTWDSGNGVSLFITSPEAVVEVDQNAPGGYRVTSGTTHWAVTRNGFSPFNGLYLSPPILVDDTSDDILDITEENGGVVGGFDPDAAGCYRITAVYHGGGFAFSTLYAFYRVD